MKFKFYYEGKVLASGASVCTSAKSFIKKDFVLFLQTKKRSLTPRVQEQYLSALNNYIENFIQESAIDDYKSFFFKTFNYKIFAKPHRFNSKSSAH